ncbi:putative Topless family protein [Helianthus anomalus]
MTMPTTSLYPTPGPPVTRGNRGVTVQELHIQGTLYKSIHIMEASPRIRFNKDGALLAVSAQDNGIKILANSNGLWLLRTFENLLFDGSASRTPEAAKPTINTLFAAAPSSAALAERVAFVGTVCVFTASHLRLRCKINPLCVSYKV